MAAAHLEPLSLDDANNPARWRRKAVEARELAELFSRTGNDRGKDGMIVAADSYEWLADLLEKSPM